MFLTIFFILITFLAVFIVYDEFRRVKPDPTPTRRVLAPTPSINVFLTLLFLAVLMIIFSSLFMLFKQNNILILPVFIGIVGTILAISYVILPAIYNP